MSGRPTRNYLARFLRECFGTQRAAAAALGVSAGYLSRMAAGALQVSAPVATKLAELTGVSVEAIYNMSDTDKALHFHRRMMREEYDSTNH